MVETVFNVLSKQENMNQAHLDIFIMLSRSSKHQSFSAFQDNCPGGCTHNYSREQSKCKFPDFIHMRTSFVPNRLLPLRVTGGSRLKIHSQV